MEANDFVNSPVIIFERNLTEPLFDVFKLFNNNHETVGFKVQGISCESVGFSLFTNWELSFRTPAGLTLFSLPSDVCKTSPTEL